MEIKLRYFLVFLAKFRRVPKRIRFIALPYLWPAIARALQIISHSSRMVNPESHEFEEAVFLRSENLNQKMIGLDLTSAARSWVEQDLNLRILSEIKTSGDLKPQFRNKILIIDFDWIFTIHEKPFMFFKIFKLGIKVRRLGMPVWIFLGDTFAVRYLPATCFLVAFCGGSIILQPNTPPEAEVFGIIFPSGPFLWTMSKRNIESFSSGIEIMDRPKVILLARTGELRRINFMNKLEYRLREIGWDISSSDGKLTWEQYANQSKNVKAIATTNWMHKIHIRGTKKTREKISKTTTTHRVWEGFASGSMVMAQRTEVLDYFGFLPGTHYFELWPEEELNEEISFLSDEEINSIAVAGQKLFLALVKNA